jgi:DHA1 family bicyclomycin/chloramphenicol resistance-like MFS transporter
MVLLAACTALGPLALNVYLPSLPAVQAAYGAGLAAVQSTVSLALLSFGLGLVLLGPLADRFGRRPALLWGLVLFMGGALTAWTAPSLLMLCVGRMLASVGAAMTFITSRAVVADLTPRDQLQRSVAQITMINLVGQMVAPILGNVVMSAGGWRSIQLALLLLGALLWVMVWRNVQETLPARAAAPERDAAGLLAPTLALLARRRFLLLMLQVGLLYSAYPAFVAMAPHLMVDAFHRPISEYSYYFACLPLGYFAGNWFVLHSGYRLGQHRLVLIGSLFATFACVVSLLLLANGVWHPLALFIPAGTLMNFGMGLALPSVSARAVGESWPNTASGWGLVGFAQQLVAALSVQALGFFHPSSPLPVVWCCMGFAAATWLLECLPQISSPQRDAGTPSSPAAQAG